MALPTVFLSHGSPMHAIDAGIAGRAWAELGQKLPRPRAVLIASAHWETSVPMLTGSRRPETIHDFGGFPEELYRLRYPAPGAPEVASEIVARFKAVDITAGIDGCRGLDHGAYRVACGKGVFQPPQCDDSYSAAAHGPLRISIERSAPSIRRQDAATLVEVAGLLYQTDL